MLRYQCVYVKPYRSLAAAIPSGFVPCPLTTTMSAPRIPLELQELIIDLVDDDFDYRNVKRTLYSCALTCRAWVPRARGRLYHTLHLEGVIGTSLNTLVDILEHTTDVSRGVRELWISDKHYDWANPALDVATILLILARKLPRLVSLTIHRAMVTSSPTRGEHLDYQPSSAGSAGFRRIRRMLGAHIYLCARFHNSVLCSQIAWLTSNSHLYSRPSNLR
ncbi:hypothetical protein OH76DRAFT_193023 [Lentinus brumalis]|uniref:F-box domain-containing protein n=1 Tax=Lentinus brumalis TaxID=2498619 RepID=A0A371CMT4_9APHY|nr:hypothetical protein OH76DRAFT_193023 [Polyporus brumalis]